MLEVFSYLFIELFKIIEFICKVAFSVMDNNLLFNIEILSPESFLLEFFIRIITFVKILSTMIFAGIVVVSLHMPLAWASRTPSIK